MSKKPLPLAKARMGSRIRRSTKPSKKPAEKPAKRSPRKTKPRSPANAPRGNSDLAREMLAAIVDSSEAGIVGKTLDGIVMSWNRSAEEIFGYSAAEMVGNKIDVIASPNRPGEMKDILQRVGKGERLERFDTERRRKDGRLVRVQLSVSPIRDKKGRIVGVSKIVHDMTRQLGAQSMISNREARLRSILDTAPDAIITIDERGIIQSFSHAAVKLFGYSPGEVIGHNIKMLMPPPYHEEHDGYLERYGKTGDRHIIGIGREVKAKRKDGSIFPMELAVGEVNAGGERIFTGFIRDLTARTKMEEQLRQSQKMEAIGQLTGGLAHDFNNLLTVITGNLELLERQQQTEEGRELLQEVQEAAELGAQLSRRLLAFGRRQPLNPKPVDIQTLMGGVIDLLRRTLGEAVEIESRLAAGLPMISVDPGQIENALLNLAINARDAMPGGGKLIVETAHALVDAESARREPDLSPGSYVVLAVTDTGTGMPPEVRDRVFEPFFTTKEAGAGSGLGLSMVYGFVKQSGGHVRLYSELGHGTTIRLYLPANELTESTPPSVKAVGFSHRISGGRILVVEDQPRVRRVTVRRLKELGYFVLEADGASAALAVLERGEPIDLLFTDVVMPGGMTGIELAAKVREHHPEIRTLFTSGFSEPEKIREVALATSAGWLAKPYGMAELDTKLRELLGR